MDHFAHSDICKCHIFEHDEANLAAAHCWQKTFCTKFMWLLWIHFISIYWDSWSGSLTWRLESKSDVCSVTSESMS